jgi:hypothetical protein
MQQRKRKRGLFGTLLLGAILATAAFAYTANVNINPSGANVGYGNATVAAGYAVSNIDYAVSANFQNVTAVQFDIAPLPSGASATVRASLNGGTTWTTCTIAANPVVCTLASPVTVLSVTTLDVYAKG